MLRPWVQMSDDHLHSLHLQVLGWYGANLVGDLIPFHRHILPLNVGDVDEDVLSAIGRPDEAMTLRPAEVFADAIENRS